MGGAEWQGGPVVYDSIDFAAQTARLSETGAVTASQTGEIEVQVAATANALHLYGLSPGGNFVVTSIFNFPDGSGGYAAIMSRHNERPLGLHTSVFSGSCN
jgi:hypothetical protein